MSEQSTEQEQQDTSTMLRKAYTAATQRVREAHRDEFNGYMAEEAKVLGIDWQPRLSPEDRALKDVQAILDEHPDLAVKVRQMVTEGQPEASER